VPVEFSPAKFKAKLAAQANGHLNGETPRAAAVVTAEPVEPRRSRRKARPATQPSPEPESVATGLDSTAGGPQVTNLEFLQAAFGGEPAVYVLGFLSDPSTPRAKWRGKCIPMADLPAGLPGTSGNTYFSTSSFPITARSRSLKDGKTGRVVVLDDPTGDRPLPPSYVLQTSPSSTQVGYFTDAPIERVNNLLKALVRRGVIKADPSGNNAVRWVRLPEGHNTKEKYGTPFAHQMREWHPQRTYTIEQLEQAFGVTAADEAARQEKTQPAADFDRDATDGELIKALLNGSTYHGPMTQLAARYHGRGFTREGAIATIEGFFDSAPVQKDTWAERRADIERTVDTAIAKYAKTARKLDPLPYDDSDPTERPAGFLVSAHDIEEENIDWIWKHHLARGMFHLIAGHPGTAKSTIGFDWAAAISSGGRFPDGTAAPHGKVVIWSGEDSVASVIKPRMRAAGADFDNVFFVIGRRTQDGEPVNFDPAIHMEDLRGEVERLGDVAVIIVDPIVSAIKSDSHKNAEVRNDLQPLVDLLEEVGAIGLGITHFTKGTSGRHVVERVTGSLAFAAVARMVFCTVQEKDEASKYRIVVGKTNIAPLGGGYEYAVEPITIVVAGKEIETTRIAWGDKLDGEPLKLISDAEGPQNGRPPEKREDAVKVLLPMFAKGPILVSDLKKACEANGISYDTMKRAAKSMGAVPAQVDPSKGNSPWQWVQPLVEVAKKLAAAKAAQ
jgi:hypothetical protein